PPSSLPRLFHKKNQPRPSGTDSGVLPFNLPLSPGSSSPLAYTRRLFLSRLSSPLRSNASFLTSIGPALSGSPLLIPGPLSPLHRPPPFHASSFSHFSSYSWLR